MSLESDALSPAELQRYARHLSLPDVGLDGQRRLKRARILLVGAGGLGSPAALYLAAAGVGHLGVVDFDVVAASNLQRQILHGTGDIARRKTDSARDRLYDVNPHVRVETYDERLTARNALEVVREYDLVVDGTDNFATRYLTNDACVLLGRPNVYASVSRFEGQATVFATADGPCYRCLYPEPPPPGSVLSCAEGGVLGVLPGLLGTIQATEAIKLITGIGESLAGRLLLVDAARMHFRTVQLRRDPACPACGTREITELVDYDAFCGDVSSASSSGAAHDDADDADDGVPEITPRELAAKLARGDSLDLLDVREPYEHQLARIPGARLLPLGTFALAVPSLDPAREVVVLCHHGVRSAAAAEYLQSRGFRRVSSLAGGINRWSDEVDPGVPKY